MESGVDGVLGLGDEEKRRSVKWLVAGKSSKASQRHTMKMFISE